MTHNVPEGVAYGTVHGEFMSFAADMAGTAAGPDGVPDKIPMEGYVVLTPQVETVRWPSLVPPITAVIQDVRCPLIEGKLYPPGTAPEYAASVTPGVVLVATEQPEALPSTVQYTLTFDLKGIKRQPNPVTFEVPSGGVVDLTTVIPATPVPGTVVVVSSVDRERAEDAASAAEAAADTAETAATVAVTAKTLAEGFAGDAETARDQAVTAANALQDTGWRNIADLLNTSAWELNPSNGYLRLKRTGSRVTLAGRIKALSPPNQTVVILPPGFRQFNTGSLYGAARLGSTVTLLVAVSGPEYVQTMVLPTVGAILEFEISFETLNPFPTTLPGTPA